MIQFDCSPSDIEGLVADSSPMKWNRDERLEDLTLTLNIACRWGIIQFYEE